MSLVDLVMPKMGESIMEATILKWCKQPGDHVKQDETLLEIATDKVDSEVPSIAEGTLEEILFQVNDVVPIGAVIARIRTSVEAHQAREPQPHEPAAVKVAPPQDAAYEPIHEPAPAKVLINGNGQTSTNRFYSPLVLNIAASEGVPLHELESIHGSGIEGRVTKKDILQYISDKKSGHITGATSTAQTTSTTLTTAPAIVGTTSIGYALPQTAKTQSHPTGSISNPTGTSNPTGISNPSGTSNPTGTSSQSGTSNQSGTSSSTPASTPAVTSTPSTQFTVPTGNVEILEMDRMRRLIAEHMVRSKHTSPHVTSFTEADVTNLVHWRDKIKGGFEKREGTKITFTPLFIEAIIRCIKKYPLINSSLDGDKIIIKKDINIGMATALPSGNLIVPVIRNADQLNLVGLTRQVNTLADNARNGKLKPEDTQAGTFTMTNVGTFGSLMGTPIINQPQVAILAVGAIKKRPVVIETPEGDTIGIRHMMYLSMSYDHRIVDGSLGATFLTAVAKELESFPIDRQY